MEIRKDERTKIHRRVALTTGAFLMTILCVTVLGMVVFGPASGPDRNANKKIGMLSESVRDIDPPAIIGGHTAQAAPINDGETDQKIKDGLDSVASSLERIVEPARNSETLVVDVGNGETAPTETESMGDIEGENEPSPVAGENYAQKTAADVGLASVGVWKALWNAVWPKLKAVAALLWSTVAFRN